MAGKITISKEIYENIDGSTEPSYQMEIDNMTVDFDPDISIKDLKKFIKCKKNQILLCKKGKSKICLEKPEDERDYSDSEDENAVCIDFVSPAFNASTTTSFNKADTFCKELIKLMSQDDM